jgi:predicted nucleic acid-binding protein
LDLTFQHHAYKEILLPFLEQSNNETSKNGAREIIHRYVGKTFSYTDATSFAVMERLQVSEAFAFHPHFQQVGLKVLT